MSIEIKTTKGKIIHTGDYNDLKEVVEYCVKNNIDLSGANLNDADLSGANLYDADLYDVNLTRANLTDVNLTRTNLTDVNLYGANLTRANLNDADLSGANLSGANLYDADLSGANLYDADLSGANLYDADLSDVNLTRANLTRANLFNTHGNGDQIKTINIGHYVVNYTKDYCYVGCQVFTFDQLKSLTIEESREIDGEKAVDFFNEYRDLILKIINKSPAS